MEASSILGAVRAQRHDFLNHLQVILGYLQLNKIPEARKYIAEVVFEMNRGNKITHLYPAEVALTLLVAQNEASKKGIAIEYDVQTDLEMCALSGDEVSRSVENALAQVIASFSAPRPDDSQIKVSLKEEPGCYTCEINFYLDNHPDKIEDGVRVINARLTPRRGRAEFKVRDGAGVISLFFPAR